MRNRVAARELFANTIVATLSAASSAFVKAPDTQYVHPHVRIRAGGVRNIVQL